MAAPVNKVLKLQQIMENPFPILPPVESQIAKMAAAGFSNDEIAKAINLKPGTVANYVFEIRHKLGADRRGEITKLLIEQIARVVYD